MEYDSFYLSFIGEVLVQKPSFIRKGQALMNYLSEIWPEEYRRITSKEYEIDVDCFYDDNLMNSTLKHLEENWHKK